MRADLRRANLSGADLREANLMRADLSGADLREADLREADLWRANLREADLREADLSGADSRRADLVKPISVEPEGLLSGADYMAENFKKIDQGYIVYKAFGLYKTPCPEWKIEKGAVIDEGCKPDKNR